MKRVDEPTSFGGDMPPAKRASGGVARGPMYVMKFLTPEPLASAVIGKGGQVIKAIRDSTMTKLTFSDQGEFYPGTDCRVLVVKGDSEDSILGVASQIIMKLEECVQATPSESLGQVGDMRIKTVVPRAAAGGLIGKAGTVIKQIRESSGAKVQVSEAMDPGPAADQVVTIGGHATSIETVLSEVNRQVQALAHENWFQDWALKMGGRGGPPGYGGGMPGYGRGPPRDGRDRDMGGRDFRGGGGYGAPGGYGGMQGHRDPMGNGMHHGGPSGSIVMDVMNTLPPYVLEERRGFAMSCIVPNHICGGLIGRGGQVTKDVENRTGTKITIRDIEHDRESRSMTITGPLQNVVASYMLMMKRYLEVEAESMGGGPMMRH